MILIDKVCFRSKFVFLTSTTIEALMKTDTKNSTTVFGRWMRHLGAMLTVALMVHAVAFSIGPPSVPALISPTDGSGSVSTSPTLTWGAVGGADTYELQVSVSSGFETTIYDDATLTSASNVVSGLVNSTQYYWHVSATGVGGTSAFSATQSFTTWAATPTTPPQLPVALGAAARFAILSTTGVTNTGATSVTGDVGTTPIAGNSITGWNTVTEVGTTFVVGPDGPIPSGSFTTNSALLSQAIGDLTTAYNDAAGRSLNAIGVAGNLGGRTLYAGLYKSTSTLAVSSGNLTLDGQGDPNAVWIFQFASSFSMATGCQVILTNNAQASNVFWQVGTLAHFEGGAMMVGTIMAGTSVTFITGATLVDGRALATNGNVTMEANTVTRPPIPTVFANPAAIDLGTAANFRILASTAVTIASGTTVGGNVGCTTVTNNGTVNGDVWVTTLTGSGSVSGATHAVGSTVGTAETDLGSAIGTATGLTYNAPQLGPELGGTTLGCGIYSSTSGSFDIAGTLILSGTATDVFIFQMSGTLTTQVISHVILTGGAVWSNVFWQVGTAATLGATSTFVGNIMAGTYIFEDANTSMIGNALSNTSYVTVNGTSVLPVELVSFTAAATGMNANLRWTTATEVHNYGFEIQRRQTADWAKVGFVAGAGTSSSVRNYSYTDNNLAAGNYSYRLKQIDIDGSFSYGAAVEVAISSAPRAFALLQNYPNPFNPSTVISYQLPVNSQVTLKVYDMLGKEVATLVNGEMKAGSYTVTFNTAAGTHTLSSGVYVYRLQAGSFISIKKLVLMK